MNVCFAVSRSLSLSLSGVNDRPFPPNLRSSLPHTPTLLPPPSLCGDPATNLSRSISQCVALESESTGRGEAWVGGIGGGDGDGGGGGEGYGEGGGFFN